MVTLEAQEMAEWCGKRVGYAQRVQDWSQHRYETKYWRLWLAEQPLELRADLTKIYNDALLTALGGPRKFEPFR